MSLAVRKRYVPDLSAQMASCESNYHKVMRLIPDLDDCDLREFQISWHHHRARVEIRVEERFTYTTTLRVEQLYEDSRWIRMPALMVRLYHDARMAEVICRKQKRQLQGSYTYPNEQMHQPDEKAQLNNYLGEWLSQCLAHGHSNELTLHE